MPDRKSYSYNMIMQKGTILKSRWENYALLVEFNEELSLWQVRVSPKNMSQDSKMFLLQAVKQVEIGREQAKGKE